MLRISHIHLIVLRDFRCLVTIVMARARKIVLAAVRIADTWYVPRMSAHEVLNSLCKNHSHFSNSTQEK